MLLSEINIAYYQRLMHDIRDAIAQGTFREFSRAHARRMGARRHRAALTIASDVKRSDVKRVEIQLQANRRSACLVTKP